MEQFLSRTFDIEFNRSRQKDPVAWRMYQTALDAARARLALLNDGDKADLLLRATLLAVLHEIGIRSPNLDAVMEKNGRCVEDLAFKITMVELDKLCLAAQQHVDGSPIVRQFPGLQTAS